MTSFRPDLCVEKEDTQEDESENSSSALTGGREGFFVSSISSKEARRQITAQSWLATDTQSLESSLQAGMGALGLCPPTSIPWKSGSPSALEGSSLGSSGGRCILCHEGLLLPSLSLHPGTFNMSLK